MQHEIICECLYRQPGTADLLEQTYLIGYADRRTHKAIVEAMRTHGFDLAIWLGLPPSATMVETTAMQVPNLPAIVLGNQWVIRFSNRTPAQIAAYPLPHPSTRPRERWASVKVVDRSGRQRDPAIS